jgi:hypothetical protein
VSASTSDSGGSRGVTRLRRTTVDVGAAQALAGAAAAPASAAAASSYLPYGGGFSGDYAAYALAPAHRPWQDMLPPSASVYSGAQATPSYAAANLLPPSGTAGAAASEVVFGRSLREQGEAPLGFSSNCSGNSNVAVNRAAQQRLAGMVESWQRPLAQLTPPDPTAGYAPSSFAAQSMQHSVPPGQEPHAALFHGLLRQQSQHEQQYQQQPLVPRFGALPGSTPLQPSFSSASHSQAFTRTGYAESESAASSSELNFESQRQWQQSRRFAQASMPMPPPPFPSLPQAPTFPPPSRASLTQPKQAPLHFASW